MNKRTNFIQQQGRRIAAILMVTGVYWAGKLPELSPAEEAELAGRYHFTRHELPAIAEQPFRNVRSVHPSLEKICAWISSVGASIAMNDLDNDGLPNDISYVDPRTDQVIVTPAPGTPDRYRPFSLNPAPLPYDGSTMAPMGTLPGDYNEDGFMDILVYYWGRTPVIFLQNRESNGALSRDAFRSIELSPKLERWFTNCATQADLDGDGHLDVIIGNYFPDGAQILDENAEGTEQMQHSMSQAYNGGRNRLLLWAGVEDGATLGVRFNDASSALDKDVACGWTLALGAADLDGDLRPEIYFANDFGPDRLLHNRSKPGHLKFALLEGNRDLTTPKSKVLGHDSFKGMGVDFADINADGHHDIYVSNIAGEFALEESHFMWVSTGDVSRMGEGIAPYVDRSEQLGLSRSEWGWESKLADFNNDGHLEAVQAIGFVKGTVPRWPELHELATSNDELLANPATWLACRPGDDLSGDEHLRFFSFDTARNRFFDVATAVGLERINVTRGIATADVDGDGLLDMAVANQWDTSYFYRNRSQSPAAFAGLHLLLPIDPAANVATRSYMGHPVASERGLRAIGASVVLHFPDGRKVVASVDGGNGHSGKRSADIQFGLGSLPANAPLKATISWRDRAGNPHRETVNIKSGWQTIILASSQQARTQA